MGTLDHTQSRFEHLIIQQYLGIFKE